MKRPKAQSILFWVGVLFIASGLFHVAIWIAAGTPSLVGPITWRKPIVFGLSTGVLSWSLAWVVGLLPETSRLVRQAWAYSALMVAEVGLIDLQQWRGVASHFNAATPLDGAIFTAMGVLIVSAAVIMAIWTRGVFRTLPVARASLWSARVGMVMLNLGNVIGMIMAASQSTTLKPVHGIALHMLQIVPVAVWVAAQVTVRYPRLWRASLFFLPASSSSAPR